MLCFAACCRCLAEEADMNAHAQLVPPPLAALRAYSVKLQALLQEVELPALALPHCASSSYAPPETHHLPNINKLWLTLGIAGLHLTTMLDYLASKRFSIPRLRCLSNLFEVKLSVCC